MLVTSIIAHDKSNAIPILNLSMKSENAGDQHNCTRQIKCYSNSKLVYEIRKCW